MAILCVGTKKKYIQCINTAKVGTITDKGIYTIVEEKTGSGATKWGKLKSGAGWISLDYVRKI